MFRGAETRKLIDVYEIIWIGGGNSGDQNRTRNGERALFMVRREGGHYRLVRDWSRNIFRVTSGPHNRLPLDDSHPLAERIALLNFWVPDSIPSTDISFNDADAGDALNTWRVIKLYRGLVRHPNPRVYLDACATLVQWSGGWGQDECWESLTESDREHLRDGTYERYGIYTRLTALDVERQRSDWNDATAADTWRDTDLQHRRMLTAINNRRLRPEFCRLWAREYPGDHDNGCPADRPPPATIVTENGDVPLLGPWPK